MGASRLKPLTVKEIQKLTATPPSTIKHRFLGGRSAPFVIVAFFPGLRDPPLCAAQIDTTKENR